MNAKFKFLEMGESREMCYVEQFRQHPIIGEPLVAQALWQSFIEIRLLATELDNITTVEELEAALGRVFGEDKADLFRTNLGSLCEKEADWSATLKHPVTSQKAVQMALAMMRIWLKNAVLQKITCIEDLETWLGERREEFRAILARSD